MANSSLTASYESLPKWAKILIQIFCGSIVGGVYRIIRFVENKNTTTLIAGIVALIPGPDLVAWIVDIVTEITDNKIKFFAD